MGEQFKGKISIDIRDSVPDWGPFVPPAAPDGAPNVVYIGADGSNFATAPIPEPASIAW